MKAGVMSTNTSRDVFAKHAKGLLTKISKSARMSRSTKLDPRSLGEMRLKMNEEALGAESARPKVDIIIKADVRGSLEAILDYVKKLRGDQVELRVLSQSVGAVSKSDLEMAAFGRTPIVTYNLPLSKEDEEEIKRYQCTVHNFKMIFDVFDFIRDRLSEKLPSNTKLEVTGAAQIKTLLDLKFKKKECVAYGCSVTLGTIRRKLDFRVMRNSKVIIEKVAISSLKHFKDPVDSIELGKECGIMLALPPDAEALKVGDVLEQLETTTVQTQFDDSAARGFGEQPAIDHLQHHVPPETASSNVASFRSDLDIAFLQSTLQPRKQSL